MMKGVSRTLRFRDTFCEDRIVDIKAAGT